ncbi:MAG: RecX family transcriptional regulator [Deltaproteobacteria bacterium]|nr:RecX family transcriptional regulator [Deltaproteobacteria bacterium]
MHDEDEDSTQPPFGTRQKETDARFGRREQSFSAKKRQKKVSDDDTVYEPFKPRKKKELRPPKRVTASSLENDCMFYLQRFVASEKHLAQVLMRKVRRSAIFHEQDPDSFIDLIDETVKKMVKAGLVDDTALARGLVQSYHNAGKSKRFTQQKLRMKGIDDDDAQIAIEAFAENETQAELKAAIRCVQKKRLGPMRDLEMRKERFQKDLAALGRAGFAYGIARQVLEPDDEAALLALADEDAF